MGLWQLACFLALISISESKLIEADVVVPEELVQVENSPVDDKSVVAAIKRLRAWCEVAAKSEYYEAGTWQHENNAIWELIRLYSRHPDDHHVAYHFNDFPGAMPYDEEPPNAKGNNIGQLALHMTSAAWTRT